MTWQFTSTEAQLLLDFIVSVAVPFIVSWLKQDSWPKIARFVLAILIAAAGGLLSSYLAGDLSGASIIVSVLAVFTAAQVHYASWFQGLGLEDVLNPPPAPLIRRTS